MNQNYPESILRTLRKRIGLDEDDTSRDDELQRLTPYEAFEEVLEWEGLIGYTHTILTWIHQIYKVDLRGE